MFWLRNKKINFHLLTFTHIYLDACFFVSGTKCGHSPIHHPKMFAILCADLNDLHDAIKGINPFPSYSGQWLSALFCLYSKTCLKQPLKNRQNQGLNGKW